MGIDRFGNPHAPNLSYARGEILRSTEDDFQKLQRAWSLIRERGPSSTYVLTGSSRRSPPASECAARPPLRNRKFADSPLEQSGFELWVPSACDTPGSRKVRC
jgi:hypothetical protein